MSTLAEHRMGEITHSGRSFQGEVGHITQLMRVLG